MFKSSFLAFSGREEQALVNRANEPNKVKILVHYNAIQRTNSNYLVRVKSSF